MCVNNTNDLILLNQVEEIKISEDAYINISLYKNRNSMFYDIVLNLNNKEKFLGRFNNENMVKSKYKDGKILIYCDNTITEKEEPVIIKVLSLYEIVDDTFYSCTEEEALNLFDKNINTNYLINKNNSLNRSDVAKKRYIKLKQK